MKLDNISIKFGKLGEKGFPRNVSSQMLTGLLKISKIVPDAYWFFVYSPRHTWPSWWGSVYTWYQHTHMHMHLCELYISIIQTTSACQSRYLVEIKAEIKTMTRKQYVYNNSLSCFWRGNCDLVH